MPSICGHIDNASLATKRSCCLWNKPRGRCGLSNDGTMRSASCGEKKLLTNFLCASISVCPCQSFVTEFITAQAYTTAARLNFASSALNSSNVVRIPPLNSEKVKYVTIVGGIG